MNKHVMALRQVSWASCLCLLALMVLTLTTGHSQQTFEFAGSTQAYAARLIQAASSLRWLVALDDVFIACYVTATLLFVRELASANEGGVLSDQTRALAPWIAALGLSAGLLDFTENHHILSLLRLAQDGLALDATQLTLRETLSSLKWLAGHLAFFMVGLSLPNTTAPLRLFRSSLLLIQLPVGACALVMAGLPMGDLFNWLRLINVLVGFVFLAMLVPLPRAVDSGEPV